MGNDGTTQETMEVAHHFPFSDDLLMALSHC
jgi:hypothetical protein